MFGRFKTHIVTSGFALYHTEPLCTALELQPTGKTRVVWLLWRYTAAMHVQGCVVWKKTKFSILYVDLKSLGGLGTAHGAFCVPASDLEN